MLLVCQIIADWLLTFFIESDVEGKLHDEAEELQKMLCFGLGLLCCSFKGAQLKGVSVYCGNATIVHQLSILEKYS